MMMLWATAMSTPPGALPDQDWMTNFDLRHPDPVVHSAWNLPGSTSRIVQVYDRSQIIEDPIGTSLWFEDGTEHVPFGTRGLLERMKRATPTDEQEAKAWAWLFPAVVDYHTAVRLVPDNASIPKTLEPTLPSTVEQDHDGWTVKQTSENRRRNFFTHAVTTTITDWVVRIEGESSDVKSTVVYTDDPLQRSVFPSPSPRRKR